MNDSASVARWLRVKANREAGWAVLGGVGLLLLGIVGVVLTLGIIYAVVWFGFEWIWPLSFPIRLLISLAIVVLLFVGNATTDREYLQSYSFSVGTASKKAVTFWVPRVGVVSNVNPIAPDSAHSYVKIVTDALYFGPRLVSDSVGLFLKANRLRRLDVDGCSAVIARLLARDRRVSFTELAESLPGIRAEKIFPQLRDLEGILFLSSDPPGMSLGTELRRELTEALAVRRNRI